MIRTLYQIGLTLFAFTLLSCDSTPPASQAKGVRNQMTVPATDNPVKPADEAGKKAGANNNESQNKTDSDQESSSQSSNEDSSSTSSVDNNNKAVKIDPISASTTQSEESELRGQALISMRRYGHNDPSNFIPEGGVKPFANDLPANLVATEETIKNLAMLNYHSPVRRQAEDGPCGAFAMSSAAENFLQRNYIGEHIETDPYNFWHEYQSRMPQELILAAQKDYYFKPLAETAGTFVHRAKLTDASYLFKTSQVKDAIDAGHPIVMATLTNKTWSSAKNNNGFMECRDDAHSGGGHYVAILGYAINSKWEGGGVWVIKNSWGETFGDKGYGYLPFGCCEKVMCTFLEIHGLDIQD